MKLIIELPALPGAKNQRHLQAGNQPSPVYNNFKVCVLWISLSRKVFPEYKHGTGLPKKGDPRKCQLFKYAYNLAPKQIFSSDIAVVADFV